MLAHQKLLPTSVVKRMVGKGHGEILSERVSLTTMSSWIRKISFARKRDQADRSIGSFLRFEIWDFVEILMLRFGIYSPVHPLSHSSFVFSRLSGYSAGVAALLIGGEGSPT